MAELEKAAVPDRPKLTCYWCVMAVLALLGVGVCWTMMAATAGQIPALEWQWLCGDDGLSSYGCSGVFASRYGKFLGLPLSLYGLLYFLSVAIWLIVFGHDAFNILLVAFLSVGLTVSVALLGILYLVLPGNCGWCLLVHVCNFLLIGAGLIAGWRCYRSGYRLSVRTCIPKAAVVGLIFVAMVGWAFAGMTGTMMVQYKQSYMQIAEDAEYQLWRFASQAPRELAIRPVDHILGDPDAPLKFVIYKDFQCDSCTDAWRAIDGFRQEHPQPADIVVIVRHWPLARECNDQVSSNLHPYACRAAYAVEAAAVLGGDGAFWQYHQALVEQHKQLDRSPYLQIAEEIGLDRDRFVEVWTSQEVREKVAGDLESAKPLDFKGVPAIFLNGRFIGDAWRSPEVLKRMAADQLSGASTAASDPTSLPAPSQH